MSLAFKSGKVRDTSYYICRIDEEYQAAVKTQKGPKETTCGTVGAAIKWVDTIIEEENNEIE